MSEHHFTLDEAQPLIDWINERHSIFMRKAILEDKEERGLERVHLSNLGRLAWGKGGWSLAHLTDDYVLGKYRFCNAFRELDRVTVWIRENIREPFADHEYLWYMLAIARFINWPPTLHMLIDTPGAWPSDLAFSPERMTVALEDWKRAGNKVETGAFMIRAESDAKKKWYSWSKQRYVSEIVLGRLWDKRGYWRSLLEPNNSYQPHLSETWLNFTSNPGADLVGWGPFMSGQVVADLRWTRYLRNAPDVGTWAPVGPGSTRGLNRLAGRPLKQLIRQEQALGEMCQLQGLVNTNTKSWVPEIELSDVQSCCCEIDKYLRVTSGEGNPRAKYIVGRGY